MKRRKLIKERKFPTSGGDRGAKWPFGASPSGPSVIRLYDDGTTEYRRPGLYPPKARKRPSRPTIRACEPGDVVESIRGSIARHEWNLAETRERKAKESCDANTGRAIGPGPGWIVDATDGHRLLALPGEPTQAEKCGVSLGCRYSVEVGADFGERFLEAATCLNDRTRLLVFEFGYLGGLRLAVLNVDDELEAECDVATASERLPGLASRLGLNADYVRPVLGCWPLRIGFTDGESPVIFELGEDGGGRTAAKYAVMPMRI